MALLYSGLDQRASGEVVVQLDQMGIRNEIRGTSIYVPEGERDRVRMALASAGLPSNGQEGYELLDSLSGFGTTSDMFDAAYWRAKEGELARTLLAAPGVTQARVHIGTPRRRSFGRASAPPTASVTIRTRSGRVTRELAMSARYLVALAIPGLLADQVAVLDAQNGVVLKPGEGTDSLSVSDSERTQKMKAEIEELIGARVGLNGARVSVNIDTIRDSETISRRLIDPESRILRQSDSVELTESGSEEAGGVTVASNLPDGDAAGGGGSNSEREESRQTERYDYTETREEVLRPAGAIRRVTVAVLVDEIRTFAEDGTVTSQPRPAEELTKLENLVKSAIGYNEDRGDVVTIESIPFADLPQNGTLAGSEALPSFVEQNLMQLIQLAALAFVVLLLGLFVVRPILTANAQAALEDEEDPALSAIDVTPGTDDEFGVPGLAAPGDEGFGGFASAFDPDNEFAMDDDDEPNALEMLREAVAEQTDDAVSVLKGWLDQSNEPEHAG